MASSAAALSPAFRAANTARSARQALLQPARRVQLLQAGQPQNLAQIANHLGQPAVVGQGDEGLVDGVVGGVVVGDAAFAGALLQALVQGFERRHIGTAGLCVASGARPSSKAITGKISSSRARDLGHKAAPARFVAQHPSATSTFSASRSGVREISSRSHSAASSKAAWRQCATKICSRSREATSSCSELGTGRMV